METNTFPLEALPKKITTIIRAMNKASGFPINFLAVSILWALAVAIGRSCTLAVKATWNVAANPYVCLIANKSQTKSPSLRFVKAPIEKVNSEILGGNKGQILANDATLEATVQLLYNNPYGLGVHRDELKAFFDSMNRYRSGGDEATWLSLYNGEAIVYNRKTDKKVMNILHPHVSLIGTVQPETLRQMSRESKTNGFFERFLWSFPEGDNPIIWNLTEDDQTGFYAEAWEKIIRDILHRGGFDGDTVTVTKYELSSDAAAILENWQHDKAKEYYMDNNLSPLFTKNAEQALRLALILQVAREVTGEIPRGNLIDNTSAVNAIRISTYFFDEARKVIDLINTTDAHPAWYGDLPQSFTTGEAIAAAAKYPGNKARTVKNILKNSRFFVRVDHGKYLKADAATADSIRDCDTPDDENQKSDETNSC